MCGMTKVVMVPTLWDMGREAGCMGDPEKADGQWVRRSDGQTL
jgi:hypothetical protein